MKVKQPKTAMIILAAGRSKRLGVIKQNLPWKNTTLLGHVIEQGLTSDIDKVFVVVGANAKSILNKIYSYDITIIRNRNWQLGMGSSITYAIHNISEKTLNFDAVLIALADQPLIESKHYNKLIYSLYEYNKTIIATQIDGRAGVPAIFDSKHFNSLSKLNKDYGARNILSAKSEEVKTIDIGNKIADIDTIQTYELLYKQFGTPMKN